MNYFKNFVNWVYISSQNPAEAGMTAKGITLMLIPLVSAALQLKGIVVPANEIDALPGLVYDSTNAFLTGVAGVIIILGTLRKFLPK